MARKLKFDIHIDTNALLCPNPNEFYSKAQFIIGTDSKEPEDIMNEIIEKLYL